MANSYNIMSGKELNRMLWNVMRRSSSSKEVYVCACALCVCQGRVDTGVAKTEEREKQMFTTGNPQMPTAHTSWYLLSKKKKRDVFVLSLDPELKIPQQKLLSLSGCGKLKPTEFTGKYWFNTTFQKISYGQ